MAPVAGQEFRRWWQSSSGWLTRTLLVVAAGKLRLAQAQAQLSGVRPCSNEAFQRLCLVPQFTDGPSRTADLSCMARVEEPTSTPSWTDFWMVGQQQRCNTSLPCQVLIQTDIRPGTKYYCFCMQLFAGSIFSFPIVQPTCGPHTESCGLEVTTMVKAGPDSHRKYGATDLSLVALLILYVAWSYGTKNIFHETGVAVVVGLVFGFILKSCFEVTTAFSYEMFCFLLLPMVIFGAGFNLQKKHFFRYSTYIAALGVVGTVMIFIFIFIGAGLFSFYSHTGALLDLDVRHRVIMASVLASTDTVAPISFLPSEAFPRLYAVVFGEGVLNDVVSIMLTTAAAEKASLPNFATLIQEIAYFFITSGCVGVAFGLGTSFIFKKAWKLQQGATKPSALLLLSSYTCYIVAEIMELSAIFALFVCAILCGHYAKYSISAEALRFSAELAEFLAYLAEAFVFGYFGLTAMDYFTNPDVVFSVQLIIFYTVCIILSRFVAVAVLSLVLHAWRVGDDFLLTWRELFVVAFAGCMRGTIAYALILRSTPPAYAQRPEDTLMVTTVLGLILVNCILLGVLFPVVLRGLGISQRSLHASSHTEGHCGHEEAEATDQGTPINRRTAVRRMNRVHSWWHDVDDKWMKPLFRARLDTTAASACSPHGSPAVRPPLPVRITQLCPAAPEPAEPPLP